VSRDEFNDDGVLTVRRVLRRFERVGPVLDLTVSGRVIGTTHEHPFFARGRGWTKAQELRVGDDVRRMGPGWATVEAVSDTGRLETVYNLEIEDDHTCFVGCDEWGFSVWAHNAGCGPELAGEILAKDAQYQLMKRQYRLQELRAKHGDVFRQRMAAATEAAAPRSNWSALGQDLASEIAVTKSMMRHYGKADPTVGVNLRFGGAKSDWNATKVMAYNRHLGEQLLELNRLSIHHPEVLRYNIINYDAFVSMNIIGQMRRQAGRVLGPKPVAEYTGQTFAAGHWLDSVAGGQVWNFVGWRDGVPNSTIGSRWAAGRVDQIVPGRLHWGN